MHQLLNKLRDQLVDIAPPALIAGYYEYADSWNDRALYLRVHYQPLQRLHVELYIDHSKPEADVEIKLSLGAQSARFMSLISPGHPGWPCHGNGVGTLLANCSIAFLQAIYPPQAVLTGWAPLMDSPMDEDPDQLWERRWQFWARFGVMLDEYNMFDVQIGDLTIIDNGKSCLEYFPRVLPVSAFRYAGSSARHFRFASDADGEGVLWSHNIADER